ncbi:unnamed protein product, partial [Ectocarpus fasciculatus]
GGGDHVRGRARERGAGVRGVGAGGGVGRQRGPREAGGHVRARGNDGVPVAVRPGVRAAQPPTPLLQAPRPVRGSERHREHRGRRGS